MDYLPSDGDFWFGYLPGFEQRLYSSGVDDSSERSRPVVLARDDSADSDGHDNRPVTSTCHGMAKVCINGHVGFVKPLIFYCHSA